MSLYKRGGVWWYGFIFNGQRIQRSSKVENRREAENIEKAAWTQLARGEVGIEDKPKPKIRTVGELLDSLRADYELRGKGSVPNLSLISVVKEVFGTKNSDKLTNDDVVAYVTKRRKEGRADSTISNHLQVLSQAFILAKLTPPDVPRLSVDNARSGFFGRDDFDRVCSRLPEDLRDFCLFGFLTGWRKNAIATLEWSDIRDGNAYLRGVHSKNGRPYFVPLIGELASLVERREAARPLTRYSGVVLSSLVFHRDGRPVNEFRKSWDSACIAAGLGAMVCPRCKERSAEKSCCSKCKTRRKYAGRIFHDLRRSAARNLIRAGVSQAVAMRITGHETDAMFRRYNITSEDDLRDAMMKITKRRESEPQKVVAISK
jgi:integrase